jgi:hypothetical protein
MHWGFARRAEIADYQGSSPMRRSTPVPTSFSVTILTSSRESRCTRARRSSTAWATCRRRPPPRFSPRECRLAQRGGELPSQSSPRSRLNRTRCEAIHDRQMDTHRVRQNSSLVHTVPTERAQRARTSRSLEPDGAAILQFVAPSPLRRASTPTSPWKGAKSWSRLQVANRREGYSRPDS